MTSIENYIILPAILLILYLRTLHKIFYFLCPILDVFINFLNEWKRVHYKFITVLTGMSFARLFFNFVYRYGNATSTFRGTTTIDLLLSSFFNALLDVTHANSKVYVYIFSQSFCSSSLLRRSCFYMRTNGPKCVTTEHV